MDIEPQVGTLPLGGASTNLEQLNETLITSVVRIISELAEWRIFENVNYSTKVSRSLLCHLPVINGKPVVPGWIMFHVLFNSKSSKFDKKRLIKELFSPTQAATPLASNTSNLNLVIVKNFQEK